MYLGLCVVGILGYMKHEFHSYIKIQHLNTEAPKLKDQRFDKKDSFDARFTFVLVFHVQV